MLIRDIVYSEIDVHGSEIKFSGSTLVFFLSKKNMFFSPNHFCDKKYFFSFLMWFRMPVISIPAFSEDTLFSHHSFLNPEMIRENPQLFCPLGENAEYQ